MLPDLTEALRNWLKDWGTLLVALWGAITGTLGIVHSWRLGRRDRAKLMVVPEARVDDQFIPPSLALVVEVTNTGRRPIQVSDYVLDRPVLKYLPWRLGFWRTLYRDRLAPKNSVILKEGERRTLRITRPSTDLLLRTGRVRIVDTTGKVWKPVKPLNSVDVYYDNFPSAIKELQVGSPGEAGFAYVSLYPPKEIGTSYRIQGRFYGSKPLGDRQTISYVKDFHRATEAFEAAVGYAEEFHEKGGRLKPPSSFPGAGHSSSGPIFR